MNSSKLNPLFYVGMVLLLSLTNVVCAEQGINNNNAKKVSSDSELEAASTHDKFAKDVRDVAEQSQEDSRERLRIKIALADRMKDATERAERKTELSEESAKWAATLKTAGQERAAMQAQAQSDRLAGKYAAAIKAYDELVKTSTGRYKTHMLIDRGILYLESGDKKRAAKDYEAAKKSPDKEPDFFVELASLLGKWDEAKQWLAEDIARLKTKNPQAISHNPVCFNFEEKGAPVEGCMTHKIVECFNNSFASPDKQDASCKKYQAEIQYLRDIKLDAGFDKGYVTKPDIKPSQPEK